MRRNAGQVIAAGGGAFVDPDSRAADAGQRGGFLPPRTARDDPETAVARTASTDAAAEDATGRPMLAGDDVKSRVESLLAQRADAYVQAHHTIETDALTPEQAARRILEAWQQ